MSNTTLAYYKLKSPASILNSPYLFRYSNRRTVSPVSRAGSSASARSIVLRLLITALILVLTGVAQAQRVTAATHIVRPGETLGLIAQNYGVDIYTLASANGISNAHLIHTWQELTIPSAAGQQTAVATVRGTHIVRRGETLEGIAKSYGIALSDLIALNNVFGWIYPGEELALPVPGSAAAPAIDPAPVVASGGNTHIVRDGETLGTIAAAYGLSLYDLQAANNIWTWIIYVGQELTIPGDGIVAVTPEEPATPDPSPAPIETSPPVESSGITHTVRFGETLAKIAAAYDVPLYDLQALNDIWSWMIYVGQELEIPAGGTPPAVPDIPLESAPPVQTPEPPKPVQNPAPIQQPETHTVQRGETLFRIAKTYGVDLDALIRANGIADATKIHSGLVLRVSNLDQFISPPARTDGSRATATAPTADSPAPASQSVTAASRTQYTVQPGEFLSQIGAKFGINWRAIVDLNGITNPDNLHAGTVLSIPSAAEAARYGPVVSTNFSRFHNNNDHPGAKVGVGKEIVVVLSTQTAYAYQNGQLMRRALISSGLPKTPTVQGDFKVRHKVRSQRMTGEDYDLDNVEWVMYFYQGYALHGTWWHHNFGTPMSRGCVNMTNADAKWFYDFAPIGTPVHVRFY